MSNVQTVKKLSHSHFVDGKMTAARVAKHADKETGLWHVMRLAGMVLSTEVVATQYGESIALIGSFQATDPATGETIRATKCYLPDVATGPLAAAVKLGQSPTFAVDISAKLSEKSSVGFEYVLRELVEAQNDPVAQMLAQASQMVPLRIQAQPAAQVPAPAPEAPAEAPAAPKGRKAK